MFQWVKRLRFRSNAPQNTPNAPNKESHRSGWPLSEKGLREMEFADKNELAQELRYESVKPDIRFGPFENTGGVRNLEEILKEVADKNEFTQELRDEYIKLDIRFEPFENTDRMRKILNSIDERESKSYRASSSSPIS